MATIMNRRKKTVVLVAAAGMTLAGTGVAFAYWTSTGEGEGTATTGESVNFVVGADDPVGDPLTPGGPSQTVAFTVTNPGTGTLNLNAMTVAVANADGSPWVSAPGCSALDYTVTLTTTPAAPTEVDGGEVVNGEATVSMVNRPVNQDGCQNVDVPLYFVAGTPTP